NVSEVRKTGERTYHWVVEGPLGQRIEWDAEVTRSEPGRLIAWRSTTADVPNSGEVHFEPTRHGTRVMVVMQYGQPAGPIGALLAKVTGSDPQAMARQDMRRFKQLIEAGEIAQAPQLYRPEKMRLTEAIAQ
ncbi:MAG TPA: SRPBCC family protein, partial [Blastocatellia bacterium]|nr:SRPBCC family protein [Blastocatellia bacterium]